jgi:DNA-binding CsgD family transcriptional regulator/type II secretory pathway predicted ATPase ExeA
VDGGPARVRAPGFVGRERELAALGRAIAADPSVVLVEGEAGIGKTRLMREFLSSREGMRTAAVVASCPPFRHPHTLGPVADAIRQAAGDVRELALSELAGALRPLFPEWVAALPPAPPPAEDASAARHLVFRALAEILARLGTRLLVVEDVHWADDATLEFLLFLAASGPDPRLSLVLTARPEDVPGGSLLRRLGRLATGSTGVRLALPLLDVTQTASLVSSMLAGAQVSGVFAAFLHEHTEGLPLAVEESVRLMGDRADLTFVHGAWERRGLASIMVPPTVRDAVLERTARLSPAALAVLSAAAVLGEAATESVLLTVAGLAGAEGGAGLSEALDCGLLTEDFLPYGPRLTFRHTLAAQAVYEAIPVLRRRDMHLRAGHALEDLSPLPAARLAEQFREAGDTGRWRTYAEMAARLALASGDPAGAAGVLHDLLTRAELPGACVARLTRMLPFTALKARPDDLLDTVARVLESGTLTPEDEASLRFFRGRALTAMQRWVEARAELERAVPGLDHDPAARTEAMILLAWPRGTASPARVHAEWLRRAQEQGAPQDPAARLRLAVHTTTALLTLGTEQGWAEAARIPAEAATGLEMREIIRGHVNVGAAAIQWGHYGEAASRLARALELAGRRQHRGIYGAARLTQMHLDWLTGSWAGLADRAAALAAATDEDPVTTLEASMVSALLDAAAGRQARAAEELELVCSRAAQQSEMEYLMESAAALARLRLAEGRAGEALRVTDEPIGIVTGTGIWLWAADLAPARAAALAGAGRVREAGELAARFGRGLRGCRAPAARAGLVASRAIVTEARGEPGAAAALFGKAAAAWQTLPRPYEALLARERQAACLLAAGRRDPGLDVLGEAFHGLCDLGARGDAVRLMTALREHGVQVRPPWRGGRPGYGEELSPREIDVIRLLAGGRTNREIGQALFLSPRTVARHLYRAMRKLDVSSRGALAARAAETGLVASASG